MKKNIFVLALLVIIATGAFAQGFPFPMAAGGGLLFDWSGNNGFEGTYVSTHFEGIEIFSFGGFGFFDATYAELDVGFSYGSWTYVEEESGGYFPGKKTMYDGSALQLGFTLLGKYPLDFINLGSFTLFPLLGFDYNLVLSVNDKSGGSFGNPGDFNQFGLLVGAGADYALPFSDALFLRAEVLFHLRFSSKFANDGADAYRNEHSYLNSVNPTLGLGPRIKIGVGYKFGNSSGSSNGSNGSSKSKSPASSAPSQPERYMLVNTDTLNVRSGPSADNSIVGQLARNTRVEVLESSGTWWKIKSGNIQGYVNSSLLKEEN